MTAIGREATVAGKGPFLLLLAGLAALAFFHEGIAALLRAWQLPEYSHGPLIPVLSLLLFLRQLKSEPILGGPVNRWPGVGLLVFAMALGALGKLSEIDDVTAYALILWVGAMLLISFGWEQGRRFWPPVLHLVYMLPLPGLVYYKLSTFLQAVSSELGVLFLQLMQVPVFLDGNIIDLGVTKLHVAEACSGLRYLFPILSFSYIFAVLYRGPLWHKAVLLVAAAPIAVLMNSIRIALAGWIVNHWGIGHVEGFSHFFEGWVIFLSSVMLLFALAWLMLFLHPTRPGLVEALDLDTSGLLTQAARVRLVEPSWALVLSALLLGGGALLWHLRPEVERTLPMRESLAAFPRDLGNWHSGTPLRIPPATLKALAATDHHSAQFRTPDSAETVDLFIAWYEDQTRGGTHSPEICLPSSGWEIARLERVDIGPAAGLGEPFPLNRVVIQRDEARMMVYYWFEQHGRHVAWDFEAKFWLLWDGLTIGRTDGALVRILTPIGRDESEAEAEARLQEVFLATNRVLTRFVPE
ncbi:VPLPA-CTERM-specific exosortase XrtD [Rhodobacter sp. CZR27]|uniref:VPLPA-CTERM-specific exosortase XrtD n=1 Tax=Rhodobacter sp. CZR27 TaxID=2033869 RepID=UPI000BBEC103|nr:VPLPA-CTERM-specific exosortase XrtD [Rhodobacter sp. CZR27]